MTRYYMIVENVCEVFYLGEFSGLIEAERSVEDAEHYTHGLRYILVEESHWSIISEKLNESIPHRRLINMADRIIARMRENPPK
jgi:hypothetical protein